jgi:hypothetical protein
LCQASPSISCPNFDPRMNPNFDPRMKMDLKAQAKCRNGFVGTRLEYDAAGLRPAD